MRKSFVYLDHNANSPLLPAVRDQVLHYLDAPGNPSSIHGAGKAARHLLENTREILSRRIGARPQEIIFTSGGTEANNLGVQGFPDHLLLTTPVEHASLWAHTHHYPHALIRVDTHGRVDLDHLESLLIQNTGPKLVALALANNESGVLHPIREVIDLAHRHGALVLGDAVQALSKMPLNFHDLGLDMMSLSAHKIGGMMGCGALVVREGLSLQTRMLGGGQERSKRAGTPNTLGIVSFGIAADHEQDWTCTQTLRDKMETTLKQAAPGAHIFGESVPRLPNTTAISMPNVPASTQLMAFDLQGICLSTGSACSSSTIKTSRIFEQLNPQHAPWTLRISLGTDTTQQEIDQFTQAWISIYQSNQGTAA